MERQSRSGCRREATRRTTNLTRGSRCLPTGSGRQAGSYAAAKAREKDPADILTSFLRGRPHILLWKLDGKHVGLFDLGRFRKEFGSFFHERGRHLARQVRLPTRLVGKRVEDAKRATRPRRIPNHATVLGSCCTSGRPERRKLATSSSFPGFASKRTNNANLGIPSLPS